MRVGDMRVARSCARYTDGLVFIGFTFLASRPALTFSLRAIRLQSYPAWVESSEFSSFLGVRLYFHIHIFYPFPLRDRFFFPT